MYGLSLRHKTSATLSTHRIQTQLRSLQKTNQLKQCVALTGCNTTGPPSRVARGKLRCIVECYRRRQMTDDDRQQRPLLVWPTYTVCRRARNNHWILWL